MYQEKVMVPMGDWAKSRLKKLSNTDKIRDNSKVGSGFGKNISNWLERERLILPMYCTWPPNAVTKTIVLLSLKNFLNGSSSYSPKNMIPY